MYSASAVERATQLCFLLLQLTGPPPILNRYPDVDLRSSISPAQSASEKPVQSIDESLVNCNQKLTVPTIYRRMCLIAFQCCSVGFDVNLATVLTAKAMSGLVRVDRYSNLPTAD